MRHQHHDVAVLVENRAGVRFGAVFETLRVEPLLDAQKLIDAICGTFLIANCAETADGCSADR
jgi:hypothetical protein